MALRDYQQTFINNIRTQLAADKKIIACAATGSGKTICFIEICEAAIKKGKTVLILTEDVRIFNQIDVHFDFILINAGVQNFFIRKNIAYLAMAQTLLRRQKMIENFAYYGNNLLIIADEAHLNTHSKVLQSLPDAYLIGFTATPDYRIAKHLPIVYKNIVIGPQVDELVQKKWLSSYKHFCRVNTKINQLQIKNGEYTESSQEIVFSSEKLYDELCTDLSNTIFNKGSIYTASIKHCNAVTNELQSRGFDCVNFHSGLSPEKASYNLGSFMHGKTKLIISVGALCKGWDAPFIDLIVMYMKTASLARYLQIIGRGGRIIDGFKNHFTCLDYGGNGIQHKLWDAEHDWSSLWKKKRKSDGAAPIKLCPACDFMLPASAPKCTNCSYIFPKEEKYPGETILVELNQKYTNLVGRKISTLSPQELADYVRSKNKSAFGARVAKSIEQTYPDDGYLAAYGAAMNYKPGWATFQRTLIPANERIDFTDFTLK